MSRYSDLLVAQGQNAAHARLASGDVWGSLVSGLSQVPGQIIGDRQQARAAQAQATRQRAQDELLQRREGREQATASGQLAVQHATLEEQRRKTLSEEAAKLKATGADPALVQTWITARTAEKAFSPDEGAGLLELAKQPGGHQKILDYLAPMPQPTKLMERDPTKDLADPVTGEIKVPGSPKVEKPEKLTFGTPVQAMVGGKRVFVRTGSDGATYDMAGRKIDSDVQPPPEKGPGEGGKMWVVRDGKPLRVSESQYRPGDLPANTREQGRPVTSGDAGRISELDTSLNDLDTLSKLLTSDESKKATGMLAGMGAAIWNPVTEYTGLGTAAKQKQATIDRVKQVIGKALEGGVLRKEDEIKYEKILPTISDPPDVVTTKLAGLQSAIKQRRETTLSALEDANYDVSKFKTRTRTTPPPPDAPPPVPTTGHKVGDVVSVKGQRVRITSISADGQFEGEPVK